MRRSSATASPVTTSDTGTVSRIGSRGGYRRLRRPALGRVASARGAGVAPTAVRRGGGRAGLALPAGGHPPVPGPHPLAGSGPGRPPVGGGRPRPQRGGGQLGTGLVAGAPVLRGDVSGLGVPVVAVVVRGRDRLQRCGVRTDG